MSAPTQSRKWIAGLSFCGVALILISSPFFFESYAKAQCPSATYAGDWWGAPGSLVVWFIMAGLLAACFLFMVIWVSPRLILLPIAALLIPVGLGVNTANYYSCFAPTTITLRSGYLTAPRTFHWSDVKQVRAWCWKSTPRNGSPYLGATIGLKFDDGLELPYLLGDDPQPSLNRYWMVKESLAGADYRYVLDPTVTPDGCPSALYPSITHWAAN